ncbi:uncharacterized protein SCHCODRAFT_02605978 [Schizophyllum commune H4-8]|uniref:uncharacterized protein n=1 Tax=Schizophyllum commune (strain H4-8 / FGSC 9210) TaxID=578458 RepID=UPI00215FA3EF|nr:uncharacterized protein SCHCODRAFT_02605978 [Schizophyllum commune H4-8]KAI5899737.1 hypothetical protein SCHCODRAFT_02605978 [Schizophyllum commune H4-8]
MIVIALHPSYLYHAFLLPSIRTYRMTYILLNALPAYIPLPWWYKTIILTLPRHPLL